MTKLELYNLPDMPSHVTNGDGNPGTHLNFSDFDHHYFDEQEMVVMSFGDDEAQYLTEEMEERSQTTQVTSVVRRRTPLPKAQLCG
jgi:hypothetical protein